MGIGNLTNSKRVGRVLGIDASTNSLAFCLFDGKPLEWGEITFSGNNVWERLADGQDKVKALRDSLDFDLIVFESAIFVQNKKTVVTLAYAFGSLVSAIMKDGIDVQEIPPVTWQNAISNKPFSKAEKEAVKNEYPDKSVSWLSNKIRNLRKARTAKWVLDNYGIDSDNDNITDAIAISSVGYDKYATP